MSCKAGFLSATKEFSSWIGTDQSTVKEALPIIAKAMGSDAVTFSTLSKNQEWLTFAESHPGLKDLEPDFLDDIKTSALQCVASTEAQGSESSGYTDYKYCLSFKTSTNSEEDFTILSVWSKTPLQLDDAERVFLDLARSVINQRHFDLQQKSDASLFLSETLNAIDEAFIVFDRDEKVVSYNKRHADLFPSLAGTLRVGASYDTLLRTQISFGQLNEAVIGKEDWIKERKRQLKIHGFTLEQKFLDGRTIRLTNYQTQSGATVCLRTDITELIAARQQAQESNHASHALLAGAPIPLIIVADGKCVYGNSFAEELFGAPKNGLNDRTVSDYYWRESDRDGILRQLAKTDASIQYTLDIKAADGTRKTVSVTSSKITYNGRRAFFSSLLDITRSSAIQRALEQSEKQNRDLLELIPDAIIVQVDGRMVYVNENAVRIFGANTRETLIGTESINLIPNDEKHKTLALRELTFSTNDAITSNTLHRRLDGSTFHSECFSKSVIWNGQHGTMAIIKDVSKRKLYENTLLQKEEEMSWAQEIGNFGHWRKNIKEDTLFWSDALFRLHGLDPKIDTLTSERARKFIVSEDKINIKDIILQSISTKKAQNYEVTIEQDDGKRRILAGSVQPECDPEGAVVSVFGVSQDVTRQRMMENTLRQSQKMEAIGQLTGGVAHDFNNLLAIIQGNAELLLELSTHSGPNEKKQLQAILKASGRGAELTASLLAFSRKQILKSTTVRLDAQVEGVIEFLEASLGNNIQINSLSDDDLSFCNVDADQVENALLNLALNARDAMPRGGTLTIETRNVTCLQNYPANDLTNIEDLKAGNYVVLSMTDTGCGIGADDLKRVFDPFYTTKEIGKGSGLGLSMVYGFAKQSGGLATIQSEEGSGTTVKIYLPQAAGK